VEPGESFEQAAFRETVEEAGVKTLRVGRHVGDTWHLYPLAGKMVIKRSVWYEMSADSSEILSPQLEEDITETKWADPQDLPHFYKNTYLSIAELLTSYLGVRL
ncbi:MAG: NUDIX hydrolase, partial [Bacteroidetes bacterium]